MKNQLSRMAKLYIALLHYPVINKEGKVVATAIANMDIHDIARTAKTFGVEKYFVINPVEAQRKMARHIVDHWTEGYGATFNPFRREAFEKVVITSTLEEVRDGIEKENGFRPKTIVTGAHFQGALLTHGKLREFLSNNRLPYLLIFGTGSGIAPEVVSGADYRLEPIFGTDAYNHLAVRSAVAIVLDRLTNLSDHYQASDAGGNIR